MSKILIIEDEIAIAELEKDYLELSGFEVEVENDGMTGLARALMEDFDLFILDLMLPGIDGFEICKQIREKKNTPILMVSAKKDDIDKIRGLGLGADDYMTKPFSVRELAARIKANLRKRTVHEEAKEEKGTNELKLQDLVLDDEKYVVNKKDKIIDLTMKEYEVLKLLVTNAGQVLTREQIIKNVWGYDYFGDVRSVDVTMRRIREKIEDNTADPKYLKTKRGKGYYV
jgi:DNA-binding response OmpR family regulator